MSEKQLEIAANPKTDQVEGIKVRAHSDMSSNIELLPIETEHKQHDAIGVQNQSPSETEPVKDGSRQVPLNLAAKVDASDSHSAQSAVRELSYGDGNKTRDRAKNLAGSVLSERRSVEGPLTDLRCENDPVEDIGKGKTAYFVVHDNRGLVDVHCEKSASERNPTTSGQSTYHDSLEKDSCQPAVSKGRDGTCYHGDDGLVTNSSSDPEQGYSSDSLLLPDARKKGRAHVQTVLGKGRRSTVWYVHPTPEGREIFEAGGEESQNPRLNTFRGVVHDGSDRIERLAVESSVEESSVVETTPVISEATSPISSDIMERKLCDPVFTCVRSMWCRLQLQFAKAPLFYVLSAIALVFTLVAFSSKEEDVDIFVSLLATIGYSIFLSLFVPRGVWSKDGEKLEGLGIFSERTSGVCGECCGRREQMPLPERRHSQYYHPLEEDAHTVFEHEIADVSNIDPKDCPQMRMVEDHETGKSDSPDSPPDFHQLNVDIHAPASPKNSEGAVARKQGASKKLSKTLTQSKPKSSSAGRRNTKEEEEACIPPTEDRLNADLSRNFPDASATLKSTLTSLIAETAASYDVKEFVCEHDGQGVACSCFADSRKQGD